MRGTEMRTRIVKILDESKNPLAFFDIAVKVGIRDSEGLALSIELSQLSQTGIIKMIQKDYGDTVYTRN
jgi:hypothetical protein